MALEVTFRDLVQTVRDLGDALSGLKSHLVHDAHPADKRSLTEKLGEAAEACSGWQFEALTAAGEARLATGYPLDLDKVRRALVLCQEKYDEARKHFEANLASDEQMEYLTEIKTSKERYRSEREADQWDMWATSVLSGLKSCRKAFPEVQIGLTRCWQELAERVGANSVSVQTRVVGQEVRHMSVHAEKLGVEGST